MANRPNEPPTHEPRDIPAMMRSPPERHHHDPVAHVARLAGPIPPAARDGAASRHKQRTAHAHDAFWRRASR